MKTKWFFLLLVFLFAANSLIAQRGKIVQPLTPRVNPMDPNGDGVIVGKFVSTWPTFTNDGYYVDEFEFKMFGLPKVGEGDVAGDNQTGPNCGVTDLIPDILPLGHPDYDKRGYSVFAHKDASNNLIFRFRIGTDANSIESWHILLDADGLFGAGKDPNALADNPGFELDITLIKKQNPGVFVTNINGTDGCPNPYIFYPLESNFQISIADLVTCGDPDYFYDFYVPISGIAGALNISEAQAANTLFRYVATTSSSATCAMSGSSSDIGGIDNDDPLYKNDDIAAYTAVIEAQCPTAIVSLCQTCEGFSTGVGVAPVIKPISVGQTVITGTAVAPFVKLSVYTNTNPSASDISPPTWGSTPREEITVTVVGGSWSVTLTQGPLLNYDRVVALSQLSIDGSSVCDSFSSNASSSVTIVTNLAPVALPQNLTTPEGIALPITLTATDANPSDILTYSVVTGPLHGSLSCNNCQNPIYTPNLNYFGPDSFTFKVNDTKSDSNIATISITVTQVNDLPVANNQTIITNEDTPKAITLTSTDVDGDPLTYTILSQPLHGTLSGTGASITYTPAANYNGPDSFTFKTNDGTGDSNTATVSITVNPVNDAPVAVGQSVTLLEDATAPITLVGTDVDGNSLVYSVVSGPANGTLTGSGANLTYAPNANYNGPDSFTFKVNDGTVDSNIATVTITVTPVNDAPVAASQNLTTPEETALAVTLSATDVDLGAVLTYTIVTPPANGTLSVVSGAGVTYTPNVNFVGADSFTFKANDGTVDSNIATIFIDVTPVNDVPVANSQSVTLDEDTSAPVTLTGSDVDGNVLTYLIVVGPLHGTLTGTGANLVYSPAANYNGPDSFTFKVNDGTVDSNIATVTITVNPVNDIPVANNQTLSTPEETALPITLSATDVDTGTIFTYTIVSPPSNGILSAVAGAGVTYTPNVNFVGSDSFTFKANDGTVDSNIATILINVTPVNDVPVANAQTVTLDEDTTTPITLTGSDPDGNVLTYLIVAGPLHGTLTGTGANLVYTPAANYNGPDSFTFKVNDGTVDSNVATVTITVNPINDAPVANNQNITTPEDIAVAIVLGPATDVDGTTLTYTVVSGPLHGVLSGTGPNRTYTPDPDYNGPDSFTFKASDGVLESIIATVSITVTPENDAPVADDKNVILDEDTSVAITLTGSDPDGDGLTYSIVTAPAHGTLTGTLPNITYTPAADYFGPDSFTYKVNDGTTDSNIATISITVAPVNDPPIALNQTVTYLFNTPVNIILTAIDVDDLQSDLVFTVLTLPANGTLTGSGTSYQFTPNGGFNGSTSFTFQVNDGTDNSNIATVTINLNDGVNYAPVSENQTVTVIEDQNKNILLGASDANGDPLTYSIVTNPLHGTVVLSGQTVLYTPDPDYVGPDSFTFKSNDGTVDSNIATVSITVTPVNDAPVAINQNIIVVEDGSVVITLTGSDVDNASLTFTVLTQPDHGTLTGSGATWTYTPVANYNGPDNFTFKASDALLDSNTGTIAITVTPVNDLPVAAAQSITTPEDTQIGITLAANDIDGDGLTYSIVTPPAQGTLSCNNCQNPIYTPALNYNGPDSFTFKANDGTGDSNVATVSITVTPVNDAPVANNQVVTVQEDLAKIITLTGSDVENSTLTFTVLTQPANGTLTGSGAVWTYTPNADYTGPDGFTFKVNDGSLDSNTGTVTINVVPLNDPPVAVNNTTITTNEDVSVTFSVIGNDTDVDGFVDGATVDLDPSTPAEDKTFTVVGQGVYTVDNSGNVTFTPALNYNGLASAINYTVKDNDGALSNVAQIQVNVLPVNDIPVADNQVVTVVEDTAKGITLTGSDVEGSTLTFNILTQPTHGTLTGSGAVWTYTPNADYTGPDSFTFKVNDGSNDSSPGTVSINVVPVNDPPVAVNDVITTPEDIAVTFNIITSSDSDTDGTINAATVDLNPATPAEDKTFTVAGQGTYTVDNLGNVTFTPVLNYNGTATPVSYTVKDNLGAISNTATIQVIVTPVNDAPVVTPITVILNEDVPTVICFTVTDVENDPSVFTGGVSLGGNGTLVLNPTAGPFCFTYTPDPDYNGPDQVQVIVCDANDPTVCSPGIITISVLPVNDPPRIIKEGISVEKVTYSTAEDTPLTFCFDVVDPEGDTYNVSNIVNVSGGGTMVLGTGGANELCFTFTPAPDFNGKTTWSVTICDESTPALCATFTIEVDVTPVNDAPVAESQIVTVIEDTPKTITLVGTDVDGDALTYTVVRAPEHGTLSGTGANIIYTPDLNYVGNDTITFKVNDGTVDSNIATVVITVTPVNDAPFITPIPVLTTLEDTELKICLGVSDVEGNTITYQTPVNVSGGGTMMFVDGNCYTFKPAQDFNGDSFWKLKVCDNGDPSLCTEITVQITVTPVNDAPVAIDTEIDVMSGVKDTVDISDSYSDVDNETLVVITITEQPENGSATISPEGILIYQSDLGFIGTDTIRYQVCDTAVPAACTIGVIIINVGPAPFKIYNGLSPNGDNRNDYWRIDGIEAFPNNRVLVFDRYNNLIFQTSGYNNDDNSWRGQANNSKSLISGDLPEGTYFYSVDLGDGSGLYSGYIVLKKE